MKNTIKILIADDDPDILEFISYNLKNEGYFVVCANNGNEAIKAASQQTFNLIILDVMMPVMDGIETCQKLRKLDTTKNTIITYLTARNDDYSQIVGLDAGADDYIIKPIKVNLLLSKVRALLRRSNQSSVNPDVNTGDLIVDKERYLVVFQGKEHILPKKEFELLSYLVSKPGRVFTRDEILSEIWGDDIIIGDRTIDVHIRKIREKLGNDLFKTIKGVGYKYDLHN